MNRLFMAIALGVFAALWEIAGRTFFPILLGLRPVIPGMILFVVASPRFSRAFAFALSAAIIFDCFALSGSDLAFLRFFLILLFLDMIARQLLTNRSLYASMGLVVLARLLDFGSSWFFFHGRGWLGSPVFFIPSTFTWSVFLWDEVLVVGGFLFVTKLTRRFSTRGRSSTYGSF